MVLVYFLKIEIFSSSRIHKNYNCGFKSLRRRLSLKYDFVHRTYSLVPNARANQNERQNDFGTRSCVRAILVRV